MNPSPRAWSRLVLALLGPLAIAGAFAQPLGEAYVARTYYTGTVAGLSVQMDLKVSGDALSGSYWYEGIGAPLELSGSMQGETDFTLEERDAGEVTGRFEGRRAGPPDRPWSVLEGRWTSADGKMDLHFRLEAAAVATIMETRQAERLSARTSVPFFLAEPWTALNATLQEGAARGQLAFVQDGQQAFAGPESFNGWWREDDHDIRYLSPELLSILETDSFYTGGAHGNMVFDAYTFAPDAGGVSRLELRDLFLPGADFVGPLSDAVVADLQRQEAAWVKGGSVTSFSEADLQVFTVSPRGLEFAFAPYAVGPYAQGPFFVTVSFEALQGLLDPGGPLRGLLAP